MVSADCAGDRQYDLVAVGRRRFVDRHLPLNLANSSAPGRPTPRGSGRRIAAAAGSPWGGSERPQPAGPWPGPAFGRNRACSDCGPAPLWPPRSPASPWSARVARSPWERDTWRPRRCRCLPGARAPNVIRNARARHVQVTRRGERRIVVPCSAVAAPFAVEEVPQVQPVRSLGVGQRLLPTVEPHAARGG